MDNLKKEIELFVRNYTLALEKLVKENGQQIKSVGLKSFFPTEFPVRAVVFLRKRGFIVNFEKANMFEVSFKKDERPQTKTEWSTFVLYPVFEKLKERASEKAKMDLDYFLDLPRMIKEHEEDMEKQYEAEEREYWMAEIDYTIGHYVQYLGQAKEVVEETKKEAEPELYDLVKIIQNHLSNYEFMLRVGCSALDRLYIMINSDMETSLFLALNGKYFAAAAILRKILEVNIRCIYLDSLQNRTEAEKDTEDWIKGNKLLKTLKQILDDLISEQIDKNLSLLLKERGTIVNDSLKESIVLLYRELNVFVHLRPETPLEEDVKFSFSEFKTEKFHSYHAKFTKVMQICEVLLVLRFPKVISLPSLLVKAEIYAGLVLSKDELDEISSLSAVYVKPI